jgi:hypothetical protein
MPVRITAVLDHATVVGILNELTPLTVHLGEGHADRWIRVERPETVELVPGVGVRVKTSAKVQWTVAGVHIPFTIRTVTMVLQVVADKDGSGRLDVFPMIEDADLKNIPDMVDDKLVEVINSKLAAQAGKIGWAFAKTLTHALRLPPVLQEVSHFTLRPEHAQFETGAHEMRMSLDLELNFRRTLAD